MREQARSLITWIREAFERNLPEVDWMDETTRAAALVDTRHKTSELEVASLRVGKPPVRATSKCHVVRVDTLYRTVRTELH